ncbi:MAG: glycogen/starch synthase [Bacteroidales bacterium]|jgi:starch synthase|nr:glycogen/starch synthase [Bacteroidales bacterium]MBQ1637764.1 glycogen/starch synthase [Bacteroidales bacterium]MBQ1753937.1 glycogen/starch synthase [Bacteroidales bacterium]MBQ1831956.1 glycogen/starch synthase [Bacteroidales bacterium]MBQ2194330.1 glycogen/starch synthase [Bacteroidales bacterium]
MEEPVRVLFVSSEIFPYMPETDIAVSGRFLPQGIQESGKEIRSFMPRYGTINERRNQLHEVIRLSGMNLVINNADRPLVIKVSSISSARMQVYFIDNEDYFHRKFIYRDAEGKEFKDNDERAIFFARGVLETVKKLRWKPDIVHCQGWISHFLPVYLKKVYHEDPIFTETKVVLSLYNDLLDARLSDDLIDKMRFENLAREDVDELAEPTGINLAKLAIRYADGVIAGVPEIDPQLTAYARERNLPILPYVPIDKDDQAFVRAYNQFYDDLLTSR